MKKFKYALMSLTAVIFCAGCGTVSKDDAASTGKYSMASLSGNYLLGNASCVEGQFDSVKGGDFLAQNRRVADLAKEGLKASITIGANSLTTVASAGFSGSVNKACIITTTENFSLISETNVSRKIISRACSGACSAFDCVESKSLTESAKSYQMSLEKSNLILVDATTKGVCSTSSGALHPVQVEYLKQ